MEELQVPVIGILLKSYIGPWHVMQHYSKVIIIDSYFVTAPNKVYICVTVRGFTHTMMYFRVGDSGSSNQVEYASRCNHRVIM